MSDAALPSTPNAPPASASPLLGPAAGGCRPTWAQLSLVLLMQGASLGCAMAALGLVLYAGGPSAAAAAWLFAAVGCVAGLLCGGLQLAWTDRQAPTAAPLPAPALAALMRQTLACAAAARTAPAQRGGPARQALAERADDGGRAAAPAFRVSAFGA